MPRPRHPNHQARDRDKPTSFLLRRKEKNGREALLGECTIESDLSFLARLKLIQFEDEFYWRLLRARAELARCDITIDRCSWTYATSEPNVALERTSK
jgi:hypothetical protein